jgi:hypothetical protein
MLKCLNLLLWIYYKNTIVFKYLINKEEEGENNGVKVPDVNMKLIENDDF